MSQELISLLWQQIAQQRTKGHEFLFTASTGAPWDGDLLRSRKLYPLLQALGIQQAGFHAFRHFNTSLLDLLRVPLKVIQGRLGHARTGSFTLDVYGHSLDEKSNLEAGQKAGAEIAKAVEKFENSGCLTAVREKSLQLSKLEARVE